MRLSIMFRPALALVLTAFSGDVIGQTPAASAAHRQAALTLEQQGNLAAAEQQWRAQLKARPRDPEAYAHLGLIASRQDRFAEAIPMYRKALALNPNVSGVRLDLGLALFKAGQLRESIPEFKILLKAAPAGSDNEQRFNTLIGMAYYGIADYANAAAFLKKAAARDTANLPLLLALAHSYLWSRQFSLVLDVYHQILIIDPDSAEANMLAGEALDEMKDNAGAVKMFREAVRVNPKEPNAHFGLGYLLWTQKSYPEAATEFEAELANDPNHAQAAAYLADTRIQMNRFDDARPLLERALKLDPSLPLVHLDLGIVYSEAGQNTDALRELLLAAKMTPNDVNVHWRLGRLYRTLGRKDESKAEFDKASTLNRQADEDLYKKIAVGAARNPQPQTQPLAPTQPGASPQN